jgi:hypothetical protein
VGGSLEVSKPYGPTRPVTGIVLPFICAKCTLDEIPGIFIRDKLIFSSERMLHKDYYRKSSVEKITVRGSQEV